MIKILSIKELSLILDLAKQLNPTISEDILKQRQEEMFKIKNYYCFGFYNEGSLVGISSGWLTVRLYSGKQLEIDNVIMDSSIQSKGLGSQFLNEIETWALTNNCETIELNTYVQNSRSHKFYFNKGYKILGFHFQKNCKKKTPFKLMNDATL